MGGAGASEPVAQNVPPSMEGLRSMVAATVAALKQLPAIAHQTANTELATVVGELDELAAFGTAGVVTMTAEAEQRGVIASSQCASTAAWVRDAAWHLQSGGSVVVAKCVAILRRADLAVLAEAIRTTDVTPNVAATVAAEFDKISPDLADGAGDLVLDAMIGMGADHGPRSVKQFRQHLLAQYGLDGAFQDEQDSKRRQVDLSAGREENGVFHYDLTLDAEGRAGLEAAIGPLSKPQPEPDGEPDPRPTGRRRGEALVEVCRRATAAGCQPPSAAKASLYVTMTFEELKRAIGAAPRSDRWMAVRSLPRRRCGRWRAMHRSSRSCWGAMGRFWMRDVLSGCSPRRSSRHCGYGTNIARFRGCEAPAHWCDAHHLKHWIDWGPTDLDNGALLCGRHHTVVHRDQLAGTILDGHVLWDRRPGSYQRPVTTSTA